MANGKNDAKDYDSKDKNDDDDNDDNDDNDDDRRERRNRELFAKKDKLRNDSKSRDETTEPINDDEYSPR